MRRVSLLFLLFIYFTFTASMLKAYTLTKKERTTLEQATASYSHALQKADVEAILKAIPPKIIDTLANKKNLNKSQFQKIIRDQIKQLVQNYKQIESIRIRQTQRREGKLDNGTFYSVMPLEFVFATDSEKKCYIQTEIIALLDDNRWYFIHNNKGIISDVTREVFPGLEKIEIQAKKLTPVDK